MQAAGESVGRFLAKSVVEVLTCLASRARVIVNRYNADPFFDLSLSFSYTLASTIYTLERVAPIHRRSFRSLAHNSETRVDPFLPSFLTFCSLLSGLFSRYILLSGFSIQAFWMQMHHDYQHLFFGGETRSCRGLRSTGIAFLRSLSFPSLLPGVPPTPLVCLEVILGLQHRVEIVPLLENGNVVVPVRAGGAKRTRPLRTARQYRRALRAPSEVMHYERDNEWLKTSAAATPSCTTMGGFSLHESSEVSGHRRKDWLWPTFVNTIDDT